MEESIRKRRRDAAERSCASSLRASNSSRRARRRRKWRRVWSRLVDVVPVAEPLRGPEGQRREEVEGAGARERLKRIVADRSLGDRRVERAVLEEVRTPGRERGAADRLCDRFEVSGRRTCTGRRPAPLHPAAPAAEEERSD